MLANRVPIVKDLVLLGGGHSHVEVLRSFGIRPMPGVRITVISRDVHTPYSGMLPGYVSGFYQYDDVHIDLAKLSSWARARLIHAEATGLDLQARRVMLKGRPPVAYDVLSIDIGITPEAERVAGAKQHTTPVKPIDRFVSRLHELLSRHAASSKPIHLVVVGGGAGGVEMALSMQYRLEQERIKAGRPDELRAQVSLVCRDQLLASHTSYARNSFIRILAQKGVTLHEHCEVLRVEPSQLVIRRRKAGSSQQQHSHAGDKVASNTNGNSHIGEASVPDQAVSNQGGGTEGNDEETVAFDECLWCTQAAAASWLAKTGLPTDTDGFISINECLQCKGGPPEVFAAGDVASCRKHPRPKAGVFAVRQGPPLAANIRRYLAGEPLQPFVPQRTFLSLITAGDKYCVATKGWLGLQGSYLWNWKDHIDRTFMRKYGDDLAAMYDKMMATNGGMSGDGVASHAPAAVIAAGPDALALLAGSKMRCGGCGAKVGASVLSRVLARLPILPTANSAGGVVAGLDSPDDAALIRPPPPGKLLVQTVDFFRSFWEDPYVFGQIAANHALGDVWAMGARPTTALALAMVPLMSETATEEELAALLGGATKVLNAAGCALVGGHTCEGPETTLGFSITGEVDEARVLRKRGLKPGHVLILTKALGTGVLMAAHMRCKAKGRWVMRALDGMCQSNQVAMEVLLQHGATAATDVTGFGLLGHLVEMTRPSQVHVELSWPHIPLLEGASEVLAEGILSSLHPQNAKAAAALANFEEVCAAQPVLWPILIDPQTGGGLLAGLPAEQADSCVQALKAAGCTQACIIGKILDSRPGLSDVSISLDPIQF